MQARGSCQARRFWLVLEAALPLEQMPEIKPGETIEGGLFHAVVATSTCYQGWYDRGNLCLPTTWQKYALELTILLSTWNIPGHENGKVNFMLTSNSKTS